MARRTDPRSRRNPTPPAGEDGDPRPAQGEGESAEGKVPPPKPVRAKRGGVVASPLPPEPPFGTKTTTTASTTTTRPSTT